MRLASRISDSVVIGGGGRGGGRGSASTTGAPKESIAVIATAPRISLMLVNASSKEAQAKRGKEAANESKLRLVYVTHSQ